MNTMVHYHILKAIVRFFFHGLIITFDISLIGLLCTSNRPNKGGILLGAYSLCGFNCASTDVSEQTYQSTVIVFTLHVSGRGNGLGPVQ